MIKATFVYYNIHLKVLVIEFGNHVRIVIPKHIVKQFNNILDEDLVVVRLTSSGTGLRWEHLDLDLSILDLIEEVFSMKNG